MTGLPRPSGTVTFLFTDIEGSTRRWEADADTMRVELAAHDDVLRTAIESHGGWLFKHTGDGVCAAFASPRGAVDAAIVAQRSLALPVRMGIATGEAEQRGDDYFGPALNRAARVMATGHGGQILLAASTVALIDGSDLVDLGEHRLRDLSGSHRLFQVRADGLRADFPRLRTLDAVPGNLPRQTTSFVGRDVEVKELVELVRAHELVTLTGVGGVGKTRLAVQVAAELVPDFPDGVWLVELAPVGDPAAVPDAVATALGITQQAERTVTASLAEALAGRRLLIVLDNCEHVLDAAADLVEAILARTPTVKVIATSREGLRVGAEHLWPVPSLGVKEGTDSGAVELFVERAGAVRPGFRLADPADADAVIEICRRLDGIALAIELAAARMVSMSAAEVRDRLGDRFRLLSGSRRGLERHQTLRQAVQWSYDLLTDDERTVLQHCSVFAGGFDLAAAAHVDGTFDDYELLDLLDSLVRKSLVTATVAVGHTRYGLLETIRQFAEDQLATSGSIDGIRDRHAAHYTAEAQRHWRIWESPDQRIAVDWVDTEFANLRTAFRWATDRGDLVAASAIAAHTTLLAFPLQRFESVAWAEEILAPATIADLSQLPRLYAAASFCLYSGRPHEAVEHARRAQELEADPRYEPFTNGWSGVMEAVAHLTAGRLDRWLEISAALAEQGGLAQVLGLAGLASMLPSVGRADDAAARAEECIAVARIYGDPYWFGYALLAYARAFSTADPERALTAFRECFTYAREHRLRYWEGLAAGDAAILEASHGDPGRAAAYSEVAIDLFHQVGNVPNLVVALGALATCCERLGRPVVAAVVYGATARYPGTVSVVHFADVPQRLRASLGDARFDECTAAGEAMELGEVVRYAREQIKLITSEPSESA